MAERLGMSAKLGHGSALGGSVLEHRRRQKLTQAELAGRAGVSIAAVRAIEHGRGRVESLALILAALGMELRGRTLAAGRRTSRAFYAHAGTSSAHHGWETLAALAAVLTAAGRTFLSRPMRGQRRSPPRAGK